MVGIQMGGATGAQAAYPGSNGLVAFVRGSDIWTVNPTTLTQKRLTFTGLNREPSWSPDGKQIAFIRQTSTEHLWVMNANGSNQHAITTKYVPDEYPTWSPDGQWIAFTRGVGFTDYAIFKIHSTYPYGGPIRLTTNLPDGGEDTEATWSPLGDNIIFRRSGLCGTDICSRLYRVSSSGGAVSPVLATSQASFDQFSPDYAPKGRAVAFVGAGETEGIWIAGTDGSNIHKITTTASNESPAWAPSGTKLTFGHYVSGARFEDVWTIHSDGTGAKLLVRNGVDPTWQPIPQP
jgi:Tol biopolymer transport system component